MPLEGLNLSIFCPRTLHSFASTDVVKNQRQTSSKPFQPFSFVLLTALRHKQAELSSPHTQPLHSPSFKVLFLSTSILLFHPALILFVLIYPGAIHCFQGLVIPLFASSFPKHCELRLLRTQNTVHPRDTCPSFQPLMCLCANALRSCLAAAFHQTPPPDPQRISEKGKNQLIASVNKKTRPRGGVGRQGVSFCLSAWWGVLQAGNLPALWVSHQEVSKCKG